ncbi:hypothetical protein ACWGAA_41640, partial [Streptomyces sp. NPDC055080]
HRGVLRCQLHCLAGIITPDSGTITYAGRALSAMSDAERSALRRSDFGFVSAPYVAPLGSPAPSASPPWRSGWLSPPSPSPRTRATPPHSLRPTGPRGPRSR